jgi:hypothetical protein
MSGLLALASQPLRLPFLEYSGGTAFDIDTGLDIGGTYRAIVFSPNGSLKYRIAVGGADLDDIPFNPTGFTRLFGVENCNALEIQVEATSVTISGTENSFAGYFRFNGSALFPGSPSPWVGLDTPRLLEAYGFRSAAGSTRRTNTTYVVRIRHKFQEAILHASQGGPQANAFGGFNIEYDPS